MWVLKCSLSLKSHPNYWHYLVSVRISVSKFQDRQTELKSYRYSTTDRTRIDCLVSFHIIDITSYQFIQDFWFLLIDGWPDMRWLCCRFAMYFAPELYLFQFDLVDENLQKCTDTRMNILNWSTIIYFDDAR